MNDRPLYESAEADKWFKRYIQAVKERDEAHGDCEREYGHRMLAEKTRNTGLSALKRLVAACYPIDMWMGGLKSSPPRGFEWLEFELALSAALSLVQSGDTTSDSTQSPVAPDDSAPSVRGESEDPGSCKREAAKP